MSKLLIWDPAYGTALGWGGNLILAPCCGKSPGSGGYNIPPAPPQSLLLAIWQTESQDLQNHKCRHQVGFLLISQCLQVSRASKALSRTFFAPQPPPNDASSKNATGFRRKPGPGSFPLHPHQHVLVFVSLILVILIGVRWNIKSILTLISTMAKGVEHFLTWPTDGELEP